jgi:uncharacterized Zn-finger protein
MIDSNNDTAAPPQIAADAQFVFCCGDAAPFGHPRIFLRFNGAAFVDCYYCGRRHAKPAGQDAHRAT